MWRFDPPLQVNILYWSVRRSPSSYRHRNTHLQSKGWTLLVTQATLRRLLHFCSLSTLQKRRKRQKKGKNDAMAGRVGSVRTEQIETSKNFVIETSLTPRRGCIAVINTHSGESGWAADLSFSATAEIMRDASLLFSRRQKNKQTGGGACRCLVLGIVHSHEINRQ